MFPLRSINDSAFSPITIGQSSRYDRCVPVIIDAPPHVLAEVNLRVGDNNVRAPDLVVGHVNNATVLMRGVLLDDEFNIISESLINMRDPVRAEIQLRVPYDSALASKHGLQVESLGRPCVLMKQSWDDNYGHWLIESLPRMGLVAKDHVIDNLTFIVSASSSEAMLKIYRDSLKLFGVKAENILFYEDVTLKANEIIYPAPMTVQPWVKSPEILETFAILGSRVPRITSPMEKIYVSRGRHHRRRLINEPQVIDLLRTFDFEIINPELFSFEEQIGIFSGAKIVIGVLGAALSNIVFSPEGVDLLGLTTESMIDDFFWDLVSLKNGSYTSLHGVSTDEIANMNSDFHIDVHVLKQMLSKKLGR